MAVMRKMLMKMKRTMIASKKLRISTKIMLTNETQSVQSKVTSNNNFRIRILGEELIKTRPPRLLLWSCIVEID